MRKKKQPSADEVAVVGLDLSLRNSAAVWLPGDWKPGDWAAVKHTSVGYAVEGKDPEDHAKRVNHIVDHLESWVGPSHPDLRVYIEDYAYGLAARSGTVLAELGGAVKHALYQLGHVVVPVNQSTARKFLLGKLPQRDRGQAVALAFEQWGATFESSDINDALVIANFARTELGLPGLTNGS